MEREFRKVLNDEFYFSKQWQSHSYLARGHYADQLRGLLSHFSSSQVLILQSEEFFAQPQAIMAQIFEFLGLDLPDQTDHYPVHNTFGYSDMPGNIRARLCDYYHNKNKELYQLIERDMGWDS